MIAKKTKNKMEVLGSPRDLLKFVDISQLKEEYGDKSTYVHPWPANQNLTVLWFLGYIKMGCVASDPNVDRKLSMSSKPFDNNFSKVNISKYDDYFQTFYTPIAKIKSMRKTYKEKEDFFMKSSGVEDNIQKAALKHAVKAFLLVVSANHNGDFGMLDMQFPTDLPFITLDETRLSQQDRKLYNAYSELTNLVYNYQQEIPQVQSEIKEKSEKLHTYEISFDTIADQSSLTQMDKMMSQKALQDNVELIRLTQKHATHLLKKMGSKQKEFKKARDLCEKDLMVIKTKGVRAYEDNCYEPGDVVKRFWPHSGDLINSNQKMRTKKAVKYQRMYDEACESVSRPVNVPLRTEIGKREWNFCIDWIDEPDIDALIKLIPKLTKLVKMHIWGKHFTEFTSTVGKEVLGGTLPSVKISPKKVDKDRRHYNLPRPINQDETEVHEDPGTVWMSRLSGRMSRIVKAISENIKNNQCIREIKLVGLKIDRAGWKSLGVSLSKNHSIRDLTINFCRLADPGMRMLARGFRDSITRIDLSNNELGEKSGRIIGKVIMKHGEKKDHVNWAANLRGECTFQVAQNGLEEICLANNKLGDVGVSNLASCLFQDVWLTSLDLRVNEITHIGLRELESMLITNKTLLYLDIRENTDLENLKFSKKILERLRFNIASYRQKSVEDYNPRYEQKLFEAYTSIHTDQQQDMVEPLDTIEGQHFASDLDSESSNNIYIEPEIKKPKKKRVRKPLNKVKSEQYFRECGECQNLERNMFKIESQCASLALENQKLKKQIKSLTAAQQPAAQASWSRSLISRYEPHTIANMPAPDSYTLNENSKSKQCGGTGDENELLNRVELIMSELTRMMDEVSRG